jgi:predicted PurR-regulated permease PerM
VSTAAGTRWLFPIAGVLLLAGAIYALRGVLTPVAIAFLLAYLLDPIIDRLEKLGVSRGVGIALILATVSIGLGLFALLVLPAIVRDIGSLLQSVPQAIERLRDVAAPYLAAQGIELPESSDDILELLRGDPSIAKGAAGTLKAIAKGVFGGTASFFGAIASALLIPMLTFYLLLDFRPIVETARDLIPTRYRDKIVTVLGEIDEVLGQFLRGQLTVMAILAVLYAIGYTLVGVRLAVPIGIVAGLVSFIPYVGGIIALGLAGLMVALHFTGWMQLISLVAVYAVIQVLEGFVITPRVVGDKLGLSPVWVLLALMAGGDLFGFVGVMIALPLAAVIKVVTAHGLAYYRERVPT